MELNENNDLIIQSLTCPDYAIKNETKDNRTLATIGDSLLSFIFLDLIRNKGFATSMEKLTNWKEIIQDNSIQNLIGEYIFNSRVKAYNNDLNSNKVYATTLEAYTYAKYVEEGLDACIKFVDNSVSKSLNIKHIHNKVIETFESKKTDDVTKGKDWAKLINDFRNYCSIL